MLWRSGATKGVGRENALSGASHTDPPAANSIWVAAHNRFKIQSGRNGTTYQRVQLVPGNGHVPQEICGIMAQTPKQYERRAA
jgi:hypothetical protein